MLRRYRTGGDVTREAATMVHVAGHGFPAPAVHAAAGPDLVMERLTGPVLLDAVTAADCDPGAAGRGLADLHTRLHALPAAGGRPLRMLDRAQARRAADAIAAALVVATAC